MRKILIITMFFTLFSIHHSLSAQSSRAGFGELATDMSGREVVQVLNGKVSSSQLGTLEGATDGDVVIENLTIDGNMVKSLRLGFEQNKLKTMLALLPMASAEKLLSTLTLYQKEFDKKYGSHHKRGNSSLNLYWAADNDGQVRLKAITDDGKYILEIAFESGSRQRRKEDEKALEVVETMPEYPGGQQAMIQFISSNLKYPEKASSAGIKGRVILTMTIERDGSIKEVTVLRGVDPLLDNEAVRVVKLMPRWIPGTQQGKPVRVQYTIPISFNLK